MPACPNNGHLRQILECGLGGVGLRPAAPAQPAEIGIALADAGYPQSVHLAFPGVDYQIKVYDTSPQRALEVAVSGDVQPVG